MTVDVGIGMAPVKERGGVVTKKVRIERTATGCFGLFVSGVLLAIATSDSSKSLSRYAFSRGADEVRHDYDLRFER